MLEYTVKRATGAVPLEGKPVGPVWEGAVTAGMNDAMTGKPPKLTTKFRMLYDAVNLYIGYEVEDDVIFASFTDHDYPLYNEDVVEAFLSPTGNQHCYYEFEFSPNAVVFDAVVLNDGGDEGKGRGKRFQPLTGWDCEGLQVAVDKQPARRLWTVTVAVPFVELHLADNRAPAAGTRWRGNLFRIEYGGKEVEYSAWSSTGLCDFHTSARFGSIVFA
ncbi:MAG: carbohydrate-binding family 9-like protein [Planctomycetota bacterium]